MAGNEREGCIRCGPCDGSGLCRLLRGSLSACAASCFGSGVYAALDFHVGELRQAKSGAVFGKVKHLVAEPLMQPAVFLGDLAAIGGSDAIENLAVIVFGPRGLRQFGGETLQLARLRQVKVFWGNRAAAVQKQQELGRADQGERAGVTGGKNMDAHMMIGRKLLTLPGFFRPTKLWDLLIINHGRLVAALELKSQVGPSFGNNFNNRTEEALGTAIDLWTAYREGAFGEAPRPFVGWLMLVEDAPSSRSPVRDSSPHFQVFPDFKSASYLERYNILCRKLTQERLYTTATVMASPRTAADSGDFMDLSELTSLKTFITSFAGHIAAEAAR
jgi:hypothetical protein